MGILMRRAAVVAGVAAARLAGASDDDTGGETRFVAVGDWGIGSGTSKPDERAAMESVAAAMRAYSESFAPSFVLALGDNFYDDGTASVTDPLWTDAWRSVWVDAQDNDGSSSAAAPLAGIPWWAVLGNHDYHQGVAAAETQVARETATDDDEWRMPARLAYVATRTPHVTVVGIDTASLAPHETDATEEPLGGADNVAAALAAIDAVIADAARDATGFLVVVGHYPVRSVGEHGDTQQLVALLLPILRRRRVDLYLCGHDHTLQSLRDSDHPNSPLRFVVSGNGAKLSGRLQELQALDAEAEFASVAHGFTAHVATAATLETRFIGTDGAQLFGISQGPPWRPKCGAADLDSCPDSSAGSDDTGDPDDDDDDSKKDPWAVGTNTAIVLAVALVAAAGVAGGLVARRASSSSKAALGTTTTLGTELAPVPSDEDFDDRAAAPTVV